MIENTNTKQFYPGPILNNTLEITDFLFNDVEQIKIKHSKLNEEDILVDIDLNYPTDYEVTKVLPSDINAAEAALTASTGQVMLKNVNVLAGEKLTVYRVSQIIQDKDYPRTGAFPAATHEGALDYLTMQNQEQKDEIDRALKVPISTQNFEGSLPLPIPSRALKINNDGTGFEMSEFDPDLALVTTEEFKNQSQQAAAEALASQNAATEQATIATQQANIATEKTAEVVESGTIAVQNIDTAFSAASEWFYKLNAIPYIPVGTILPTTGAIDESLGYQRYANGQLIANVSLQAPDLVKFLEFQEIHAPNLLCSEAEWQTTLTLSTLGQVGKYVWNKEEDTVRIPKVVNIQGMIDMNTIGNMIEAGLPNITGTVSTHGIQGKSYDSNIIGEGAFYNSGSNGIGYVATSNGGAVNNQVTLDASLSNPIYGNSDTVQEESILYPYVLQIATGVQYKTPVINEIELNKPFSLLDYKYSEYELHNLSWLRSEGQYNSKAVHPAVYDLLLKIYNGTETKAGVSIKLSTEIFTDYDFVLNTAEETFRLPIKVKLASGKAVVGNGMTIGLTDGNGNYASIRPVSDGDLILPYIVAQDMYYGQTLPVNIGAGDSIPATYGLGITTDPTKSGIETSDSDLYLYFYVGETVQNANLINAGRIEEKVADLIPNNASLISSYAMPDISRAVKVSSSPANGSTFTAPSDGIFCLYAVGNTDTDICQIGIYNGGNSTTAPFANTNSVTTFGAFTAYSPVSKGDTVMIYAYRVTFTWTGYTNLGLWFIPTKGGQ